MQIPHDLVTEALTRIWAEDITTGDASSLETFFVAKYLSAQGIAPSIATVNAAVTNLFVDLEDHPQGRIQLFRANAQRKPSWKDALDSGRKTVWNYGTRHRGKMLFKNSHFSNGLREDLKSALEDLKLHKFDPVDLSIALLRNDNVENLIPSDLISALKTKFNISDEELALVSRLEDPGWENRTLTFSAEGWDAKKIPADWKPNDKKSPAVESHIRKEETHSLDDIISITADKRIMRMLEISISSHNAVVAVGPPGTGKTTLLEELVKRAHLQPDNFGLQAPPKKPIIVTPDESWTTRELVGGETIVSGEVLFAPGHILEAIQADRWLILDEINRADMDRIFGSLFTWLSGKPVTVGSFNKNTNIESVTLGWSGKPESEVITTPGFTHYLAGDDWRLLGTYNAVDSAKVFRFGQALGRRFIRVPIPAASAESIDEAMTKVCSGLPLKTKDLILNIYRAHLEVAPLGPALFLRLPKYLQACNADWDLKGIEYYKEILAESYVINLGAYLNKLDDIQLAELKEALVVKYNVFSDMDWEWIWTLSQNLSS